MQDIPGVRVAALSDPSPAALHAATAILKEPLDIAASDYRELLRIPLDAVCIASPDAFHVPQILDSLAAGLHVLCEKPLTDDPAQLREVIRARDSARRIVALTYQRRYDAAHRAMRREILSGRWGAVTAVTIYNSEDWITPNRGTWRHDPALCAGGFFYDASGHQLDMALWATGLRAERVQAWSSTAGTPVPIRVWGNAVLTGGVPLTFHFVGDGRLWREQVNIHCERMDFFVENFRPRWCVEGRPSEIQPDEPTAGADMEFIGMLRNGLPNPAPPDEVWPVLQITRAALASAASGKPERVEAAET
jgi:predicted dehydrogenase